MKTCTMCKGTGKISSTVYTYSAEGSNATPFVSKCIDCDGSGQLNEQQLQAIEYRNSLWCRCDPKAHYEVKYWADGEHPDCSKHCYTCNNCDKIVQIG